MPAYNSTVMYVVKHSAILEHAYQGSMLVKCCLDKHAHSQSPQHIGKQLTCIVVGQVSIHKNMISG